MAPGIYVSKLEAVPLSAPSLQSVTKAATYTATLLDEINELVMQRRIGKLLETDRLVRRRKRSKNKVQEYDLRPLIISLKLDSPSDKLSRIRMELCLEPGKSGRPDEVLLALSLDAVAARIHRTKITLSSAERG